jgi:hypothetical protein
MASHGAHYFLSRKTHAGSALRTSSRTLGIRMLKIDARLMPMFNLVDICRLALALMQLHREMSV